LSFTNPNGIDPFNRGYISVHIQACDYFLSPDFTKGKGALSIRPKIRLKFGVFHMTNGTVFSGWLNQLVPGHHVQISSENTRENVLLLLELFDDSEVEYDETLSGDDDFFFQRS